MFSAYDHLKLKTPWLGEGNMHFNFCMWFFGLVKCLGLWVHILKLNALLNVVRVIINLSCFKLGIDNLDCLILVFKNWLHDVLIGCVVSKP
jgi:hypothetical protein